MHPSCGSEFMARGWPARARRGLWAAEMELARCSVPEGLEVAAGRGRDGASRRSAGSTALVQGLGPGGYQGRGCFQWETRKWEL